MAPELVVFGASKGGLRALKTILRDILKDFPAPIVVAQHRDRKNEGNIAFVVQTYTPLVVKEAELQESIAPGHVYFAPADYHLLVENNRFALSLEISPHHSIPSIDILFESAAEAYGEKLVAVVLTGANRDGVSGAVRVREKGGIVFVQDPKTAESRTLPEAVISALVPDRILPLEGIGQFLNSLCGKKAKADKP